LEGETSPRLIGSCTSKDIDSCYWAASLEGKKKKRLNKSIIIISRSESPLYIHKVFIEKFFLRISIEFRLLSELTHVDLAREIRNLSTEEAVEILVSSIASEFSPSSF